MARIAILTCANCTQEMNCASVVCLGDLRKRRGLFDRYPPDQELELIGIISCAGCPTLAAPEKILRRVRAVADHRLDALHLSYCMTALCPFLAQYHKMIATAYPALEIVRGTHMPRDLGQFRVEVHELLCPSVSPRQDMNDLIRGTFSLPKS